MANKQEKKKLGLPLSLSSIAKEEVDRTLEKEEPATGTPIVTQTEDDLDNKLLEEEKREKGKTPNSEENKEKTPKSDNNSDAGAENNNSNENFSSLDEVIQLALEYKARAPKTSNVYISEELKQDLESLKVFEPFSKLPNTALISAIIDVFFRNHTELIKKLPKKKKSRF